MGYLIPLPTQVLSIFRGHDDRFYDQAAEDIGKEIGRVLYWTGVPIIGKWIAARITARIERKTGHVIELAVKDGKLIALPLAPGEAEELEPGEIVTINRRERVEVLDVREGRVVVG